MAKTVTFKNFTKTILHESTNQVVPVRCFDHRIFLLGLRSCFQQYFYPFCKKFFKLDQIQSQLVGSAFYGAYFYGSLILYLASAIGGTDLLNKIGYKKVSSMAC